MGKTKTISIPANIMEEAVSRLRTVEKFSGLSDDEIVQAALGAGINRITENQLKTHAKKHNMIIRKDGHDGYLLLDGYTNVIAAPGSMTLEEVALWLDDLDNAQAQQ